jgi:hypothetical protein
MKLRCELASRTSIRAFRGTANEVLIVAEGELPTPGYKVDIQQSPLKIFPPQFNLVQCPLPGNWIQVITPFRYSETVRFPQDQPSITVHHADGADEVEIEECGPELSGWVRAVKGDAARTCPAGADEATGFSKSLSFEDAFSDALSKLPPVKPDGADRLERVEVLEIGGLFGGFAGFRDLFVRVCRTVD